MAAPAERTMNRVGPPGLHLEDVTTVIDDEPILHRLTLDVPPGLITVLMGPSGSGKTTLIRHITGMLEPDRGTVEVGGRDVWKANNETLRDIRQQMSVMLGGSSIFDSSLFSSLTAFENLDYSLRAHRVATEERERKSMLRLQEVGLAELADRKPDTLPAHARKRLALARALVTDTPVLILDDIEAGLDAAHSAGMIGAIERWRERTRGTVLITTHDIKLARELGENLAILCQGRIVASGDAAELLDGVEGSDEFDKRFRVTELLGPIDEEAVRKDLAENRKSVEIRYNPMITITVAVAILVVIMIFVTARLNGML